MSTPLTLTGRLTADPELRFTPAGKAVAGFTVVTSRNRKNRDTDQWEESETSFWRVTAWDQLAENIAESLSKGDAVIVVGRAFQDSYKDRDGNERQSMKVEAYNVGPDLKKAQATVKRSERTPQAATSQADDPWATATDEPPF